MNKKKKEEEEEARAIEAEPGEPKPACCPPLGGGAILHH